MDLVRQPSRQCSATEERMEFTGAIDGITGEISRAAIEVHRSLGPGLLESTYEACLAIELTDRSLRTERQRSFPLLYRSIKLEHGTESTYWCRSPSSWRSRRSSNYCPYTTLSFSLIFGLRGCKSAS